MISEAVAELIVSRDGAERRPEQQWCPEEEMESIGDCCCNDCEIPSCTCGVAEGLHSRSNANSVTILGIDPGLSTSGYGILRKEKGQTQILDFGALELSAKESLPERIAQFHAFFEAKILKWQVTTIALETPFLGKNAQNFLKLGYLRGVLYLLSQQHASVIREFAPREIKATVTGYGAAEKEQVARVILRLFKGLQMPGKLDITDALAVALCGLWKETSFYSMKQTS